MIDISFLFQLVSKHTKVPKVVKFVFYCEIRVGYGAERDDGYNTHHGIAKQMFQTIVHKKMLRGVRMVQIPAITLNVPVSVFLKGMIDFSIFVVSNTEKNDSV